MANSVKQYATFVGSGTVMASEIRALNLSKTLHPHPQCCNLKIQQNRKRLYFAYIKGSMQTSITHTFTQYSIYSTMAARSFFVFALIVTFICLSMAAPTCSSKKSRTKAATLSSYNEGGLPSAIFPDLSGYKLTKTSSLEDGLKAMAKQNGKV